jgi:hypothetical protein
MERKAAEYIKAQFDAAGIPMTLHEVDGYLSFPNPSKGRRSRHSSSEAMKSRNSTNRPCRIVCCGQ